jgi:hypothetical protein
MLINSQLVGFGVVDNILRAPETLGEINTAGNTAAIVITTAAAILSGDLVVVIVQIPSNALRTVTGVSDGTNTYTNVPGATINDGANFDLEFWYIANAAAVGSGASITATLSGATTGSNGYAGQAYRVSGVSAAPLDQDEEQLATTANPTVTTGTLAQANEIAFGCSYQVGGNNTATEDAEFTTLEATTAVGAVAGKVLVSYKITTATTALTYNPTWSGSQPTLTAIATFKGA